MGSPGCRLRKAIFFLGSLILMLAFAQAMVPLDVALWFGGETLLYLEIVSSVWLASRVGNLRAAAQWLKLRLLNRPRTRAGRARAVAEKRPERKTKPSNYPERPRLAGRAAFA